MVEVIVDTTSIAKEGQVNHLRRLGYSWKRARYAPAKKLDPEVRKEHQASLETLKRGHWTAD